MKEKIFLFEEHWIRVGATLFWALFWMLNAIDKVASRSAYWAGKVRAEKMLAYFSSINLGEPWIANASLALAGILEFVAGALFFISLVLFFMHKKFLAHRFFFWGTATGIVIFSGFIIFDVIFGDRAELLEHSIYWLIVMMSWVVYNYAHKFVRGE